MTEGRGLDTARRGAKDDALFGIGRRTPMKSRVRVSVAVAGLASLALVPGTGSGGNESFDPLLDGSAAWEFSPGCRPYPS